MSAQKKSIIGSVEESEEDTGTELTESKNSPSTRSKKKRSPANTKSKDRRSAELGKESHTSGNGSEPSEDFADVSENLFDKSSLVFKKLELEPIAEPPSLRPLFERHKKQPVDPGTLKNGPATPDAVVEAPPTVEPPAGKLPVAQPAQNIRQSPASVVSIKPKKAESIGLEALCRYPAAAYFCLISEFAERFAYYGTLAILVVYFMQIYSMTETETETKLRFHAVHFVADFTPLIGSMLADGGCGRYHVIVVASIIYCFGFVLTAFGGMQSLDLTSLKAFAYTGLFTIALAAGSRKPCFSAFAADQFSTDLLNERTQFFASCYFAINLGSLTPMIITPILRATPCQDRKTCFPLAFGVPGMFILVSSVVFLVGTHFYEITRFRENAIWRVCKCVCHALREKRRGDNKKDHWLDHAAARYDQSLINDAKNLFRIIPLFLPVSLFWALFNQQCSIWLLQANQMRGRVGRLTILPDQMAVFNPVFVIIWLPIFEGIIFPLATKCNVWRKNLRRMASGGFLAALSFVVAGFLQLAVDKTRVVVANFRPCNASLISNGKYFTVSSAGLERWDVAPDLMVSAACGNRSTRGQYEIKMEPNLAYFVAIFDGYDYNSTLQMLPFKLEKTRDGETRIYVVFEPLAMVSESSYYVSVEKDGKRQHSIHYPGGDATVTPPLLGSIDYELYLKNCSGIRRSCSERKFLESIGASDRAKHDFDIVANPSIYDRYHRRDPFLNFWPDLFLFASIAEDEIGFSSVVVADHGHWQCDQHGSIRQWAFRKEMGVGIFRLRRSHWRDHGPVRDCSVEVQLQKQGRRIVQRFFSEVREEKSFL